LRFKLLILLICAIAWGWIIYNFKTANTFKQANINVCLFKLVTKYPCPACGTSRSVIHFFHGNLAESFLLNPLGIICALLLLGLPFIIAIDYFFSKNFFNQFQLGTEALLRKKTIAIILIGLIILNWIWNIFKHL
jgi:hypothetical protein